MKKREQRPEAEASSRATGASKNRAQAEGTSRSVGRREILKVAAGTVVIAPLMGLETALGQRRTRRPTAKAKGAKAGGVRAKDSHTAPRFFTAAELAMVDELAEMIIPTDNHSPGARAAGVASYLDQYLAELTPKIPEHAREHETWRNGLKMVNNISREMHNRVFMRASPEQRGAVLRRMAKQEPRPERQPSHAETRPTESLRTRERPKSPDDNYREQGRKPLQQPQERALAHKDEGEFFVFIKEKTARAYYTSEIGLLQELNYMGNGYLQEFVGYDTDGNYTEAPPRRSSAPR